MSLARVSMRSLDLPSMRPGQRVGQVGIKNCFLLVPTSITQSSYSMRWFRQGVVSNTGGIDTGALMKPTNDILLLLLKLLQITSHLYNQLNIRLKAFPIQKEVLKNLIQILYITYQTFAINHS
ncbi:hypothetical protein FGO68_gene10466 [Halteria grandinella]|uniref:Uncharacterized protein n=1 Tax=Halteria grandinella TaxID=5974 RepID=A0A8J8T6A8_HALGN|nr:hypothetical protein FGO68_gene10466 [Halteria grandinella]